VDRTRWAGRHCAREAKTGLLFEQATIRIYVIVFILSLISDCSFAQTTRTSPSAASTTPTIRSSSSTSPTSPCDSSNPTSPCYSANAPRNPCYSAVAPDQPCSATAQPYSQASAPPSSPSKATSAAAHALTADMAKAKIESNGYSNVSGLRRDVNGNWRGKAEKDGSSWNVTLDHEGNVLRQLN
jgi:hypothetical protein